MNGGGDGKLEGRWPSSWIPSSPIPIPPGRDTGPRSDAGSDAVNGWRIADPSIDHGPAPGSESGSDPRSDFGSDRGRDPRSDPGWRPDPSRPDFPAIGSRIPDRIRMRSIAARPDAAECSLTQTQETQCSRIPAQSNPLEPDAAVSSLNAATTNPMQPKAAQCSPIPIPPGRDTQIGCRIGCRERMADFGSLYRTTDRLPDRNPDRVPNIYMSGPMGARSLPSDFTAIEI